MHRWRVKRSAFHKAIFALVYIENVHDFGIMLTSSYTFIQYTIRSESELKEGKHLLYVLTW